MTTSSLTIRLAVLVLILVGVHAGYTFVRSGTPHKVRPPRSSLEDLPLQLGAWQCDGRSSRYEDAEDIAGAEYSLRRTYHNRSERVNVIVYIAIWTSYRGSALLHEPPLCYTVAGNEIVDARESPLENDQNLELPARLMRLKAADHSSSVLYWHQLDQQTILDPGGLVNCRWNYFGQRHWPPLVKVILELRGTTSDDAERLLLDFGERILGWTSRSL